MWSLCLLPIKSGARFCNKKCDLQLARPPYFFLIFQGDQTFASIRTILHMFLGHSMLSSVAILMHDSLSIS